VDKAGPEIISQMWAFDDKGGRPVCLIPEVTGPIQELWRDDWSKRMKSRRIFYTNRCYRYERPQAGRYREFTQFGIELLGEDSRADTARWEVVNALVACLNRVGVRYEFVDAVKRGLSYYVEDGFEAVCEQLGAQKQVAGGGRYAEGIGWAIGVDRLLMAL
jgi:histidyl-tRNA synthetase